VGLFAAARQLALDPVTQEGGCGHVWLKADGRGHERKHETHTIKELCANVFFMKRRMFFQKGAWSVAQSITSSSSLPKTLSDKEERQKRQLEGLDESLARNTLEDAREYVELKNLIKHRGLLEKQPVYYTCRIVLVLSMLALGLAFLLAVPTFWLQLLNAFFLAFVYVQIGFLAHESGHRQMFSASRKHDIVCLLAGNMLLGMSYSHWLEKHNRHHSHPNQLDLDPDLEIPFIFFTQKEGVRSRGKCSQFFFKHQAYFFIPTLMLLSFDWKYRSMRFLLQKKAKKYHVAEIVLMVVHVLLYLGLLFYRFEVWQAVLFIIAHQGLIGVYMGSVFAPNHKGMPILDKGSRVGYLRRQVITARDVRSHPIGDLFYGGLNYQIEHHLFPSMACNKLKEAQRVVRTFCQEHSIAYYETGFVQSYRELLQQLHEVGAQ
jgi:fatty acid desaturase